jgi:hypothetical protein
VFHGALSNVGSWTHVAIDFDIDHATPGGGVDGTLTIGTGKALNYTLSPPLGTQNAARTLTLGVQGTAQTGATKLRFDNVTYTH